MSAAVAEAPRQTREALRAFQRLAAALEDIARRADLDDAADPADQARAAAPGLRRLLAELGAPDRVPAQGFADEAPDMPYVLTCYADEALLHMVRWRGADAWSGMLLERAIYGSEIAGERLPAAAERIAAQREHPRRDAAAALFLAFAAGFRGGLRGQDAAATVARLKAGLYLAAMDRPAPARLDLRARLGQALAHTVAPPRKPRPQPVRRAAAALGLVLVGYLLAAHLIWTNTHGETGRLADRVIARERAGGGI